MKKVFWINQIIFTTILFLPACNKEKTSPEIEYKITHWPVVKTLEVTNLTDTTATLNGTVNAFGLSTKVIFEYDTTTSYGKSVTASQSPVTEEGITNVSADISGLTPCSNYHFRIKAENSLWTDFYGPEKIFNSDLTVTDVDSNTYHGIRIGSQVWMAENLKTTKYNDGTPIPNITENTAWAELTTGAYSDYSNTPANSTTYGRLYNWYAADNNADTRVTSNGGKNVCPIGWHVPTDAEWTTLTNYLGGEESAGGKLKEAGTTHWLSPNYEATNETGFTALPGGLRLDDGAFGMIGDYGFWWSSTEWTGYPRDPDRKRVWIRYMNSTEYSNVSRNPGYAKNAYSVRCVRD